MVFSEEIKDVMYPCGKPDANEVVIRSIKHIANRHVQNLENQDEEIKAHIKTLKVQRFFGWIEMLACLIMITIIIISYIKYRKNGN